MDYPEDAIAIDESEEVAWISEKTGIPADIVQLVIEADVDFLRFKGVIKD